MRHHSQRARAGVLAAAVVLASCGGVALPDEIRAGFDLDATLSELRDCDRLSETFVAVVREAAEDIDALAEASGGLVPARQIADKVDLVSGTTYFEIAERLGCAAVAQRLDTIDRLRELDPETAAGDDLVTQVIEDLESQAG